MAISRLPKPMQLRREMLEKIGVMRAYDPLCETPDSSRIDIIIDAVGSGATRRAASALVRPGGLLFILDCRIMNPALIRAALPCRKLIFKAPIAIAKTILLKPWPC